MNEKVCIVNTLNITVKVDGNSYFNNDETQNSVEVK